MATFALFMAALPVHGSGSTAREALRRNGHEVHTVTFTGFAERRHLISRDCTVETHVVDVLNTLEFEDVSDCVLVAHSYAGSVAPGVVAAAPHRIRHVVYLDALVVRSGESVSEAMGYMSAEQSRAVAAGVSAGAIPIYSPVADQQREEAKKKPFLDERRAPGVAALGICPICLRPVR